MNKQSDFFAAVAALTQFIELADKNVAKKISASQQNAADNEEE